MQIIVHADDYGISQNVNLAICQCFRESLVNRAGIMVNMLYADEAIEMAKMGGFFDKIGLHLNLTEGEPLVKACRKSELCGADGRFSAAFEKSTWSRLVLGRETKNIIALEAEAQIEKYLGYGFPLKNLDSHHHVHTDFSVFSAIKPLLIKYNFRSIRISRNMPSYREISWEKVAYKILFNAMLRRLRFGGEKIFTTEYFGSQKDFKIFLEKKMTNKVVEIMVHPPYDEFGVFKDNKNKIISFFPVKIPQ